MPFSWAIFIISSNSHGEPKISTAITALRLSLPSFLTSSMAFFKSSGFILYVSALESTKIGVAPKRAIHSAEATNVKEETNTASPGLTPHAIKASVKASVPEAQVAQYFVPEYWDNFCSNSFVSGPWQ